MVVITQTVVCFLSISELKEETMIRGKSYKFAILNQSIIGSLWEIGHNVSLKNPNKVRPVTLERRCRGVLKDQR